jgi:type IV secretion system protein VirB5
MAITMWFAPQKAHAGVPVIDVASLVQAVMEVANAIDQLMEMKQQYDQMVTQVKQAKQQYESLTKARGLGDVLNNPMLQNYVPKEAGSVFKAINSAGTTGNLTATAKALRNAAKVYDCAEIDLGVARIRCEKEVEAQYQYQAYIQEAEEPAANRAEQINSLMELASATDDPKEIAEVQARIAGELALLEHENARINLLRASAEADERVARAQANERRRARNARTGTLGAAFGS